MSTGFGSGEGLLSTGGGLSPSSLSSIGSSLITGGAAELKSTCPSPVLTVGCGAAVETLLAELLSGGGPFETP